MQKRRILLLNPPGFQMVVRDYYCSKVSKARYLYHPVDLLMLSGILAEHHGIRVIDAMVDGWTHYGVISEIKSFKPDAVIFLTGVVSFRDDIRFITESKRMTPFVAIASGELFLGTPGETLAQMQDIDAAVLDFTDTSILDLVERIESPGRFGQGSPIRNIVYRSGTTVIGNGMSTGHGEEFEIPVPRHDLFPNDRYRYPFVRDFPFATVLTDFGCPFKCDFCAINQLGYKKRSIGNVLEELDFVKKMGMKNIYFDDQTFGADRERTETLLDAMIDRAYRMGFICFTRADRVDPDFLRRMKAAGCHTIVFGIEAGSDENLRGVQKDLTIEMIRQAIGWCRTLGIRTVGTFIVGLPGMTEAQAAQLGSFAIGLSLDFASFNVPTPRPGTQLRKLAVESGWISPDLREMDQSGSYAVMGNEHLTMQQVETYRNQASRQFYFRMGYLWRRLSGIRSWYEFKTHITEGLDLLSPATFIRKH